MQARCEFGAELDIELLDPLVDVAKVLNNIANASDPQEMQGRRKHYGCAQISKANSHGAR